MTLLLEKMNTPAETVKGYAVEALIVAIVKTTRERASQPPPPNSPISG
jgi:hypothetical protein